MAKRIEKIDIESGDIFKGIKDSAKSAESEVQVLAETLKIVTEQINTIKTSAKNVKINVNPTSFKDIQEQNKAEKEALRLAEQREKLDKISGLTKKQMQSAEQALQRQREKGMRQMEKENSAYAQTSKRLNDLRKAYKDLALAGRENESASKAMKREIDSLDATLKKVDASVGQYQRNVGNYSSAFSKLSGVLGVFGVGLGLDSIVSGVTNFSREINEMNIQASRLGVSAENMKGFVSQAQALGTTFGTDINQNMFSANVLMKEFNISQEEAFKLMEQGYLSGANAQGDMLDSVREYSSQIKASGGDANTLFNILNRAGKEGIFSDKGVDVVKEFGLRVREQTTATSEAMNNAFGKQFTDKIFKGINDGSMTSIEALEEVAKKMNDTSIPTNKLQTVIADLFGGPGEDAGLRFIQTLTNITDETGSLVDATDPYVKQQMEMKRLNEELAVAQQDLFEQLGGTGANLESLTLKFKVLFFQNIVPALGILAKLTIAFASFKLVQGAVNTNFKELIKNFTSLKTATSDGASGMSKFGSALKGVGWTVAIGLAMEFAMSLYDVYTGAQAAREQYEALQKAIKTHNKEAEKLVSTQQKAKELNLQALNDEAKRTKMSETEYKKRVKLIEDEYKAKVKGNIRFTNDLRDSATKEAQHIAKMLRINADATGKYTAQQYKEAGDAIKALGGRDEAYKRIDALKLSIASSNEELKVYNSELKALNPQVETLTFNTDANTTATNKNAKAVKEKNKKYQDATKVIDELIAKEKELEDARLARQMELGEGIDQANKDVLLSQMTAEEQELQAVQDKYQRLEDLAEEFGYGQEELLQARLNEENDIKIKYLKMELDELDKQQQELEQKEKEALERRRQERRKFTDDILSEMDKLSKEEEAKIDERIKAEQELQSNLQAQANAGNISAQQSIEASKEAERKATLDKQKEQQKQQRIEDVKTLLNLINQYIDKGDNVAIATTKGIAGLGLIKAIAKGLSGFATGTEWRLGDEHKAQMGGIDGHIVRVDSSEAIIKGSLMDKAESVGIGSTDELVKLAVMQKMNDGTNGFQPSMQVGYKIDTTKIEKRLESLENTIKNKPEVSFDPYIINGLAKGIVHTQRKGNFTRKDLYKS